VVLLSTFFSWTFFLKKFYELRAEYACSSVTVYKIYARNNIYIATDQIFNNKRRVQFQSISFWYCCSAEPIKTVQLVRFRMPFWFCKFIFRNFVSHISRRYFCQDLSCCYNPSVVSQVTWTSNTVPRVVNHVGKGFMSQWPASTHLGTGPSPGFSSRGAKNQMEGPKTRKGGHIFKIQYWMYAATGG